MKPEAFRAWRTKLGYTQAEAAEKFKVSRVTIANWETGATRIPGMVEQMCSVLEMRWKMRDEFGPVTLVYGNGALFVDPYKPIPPFQPLQREPFKTNQEAISKACQITEGCQSLNIVDESNVVLWNVVQLREECAKRLQQQKAEKKARKPIQPPSR